MSKSVSFIDTHLREWSILPASATQISYVSIRFRAIQIVKLRFRPAVELLIIMADQYGNQEHQYRWAGSVDNFPKVAPTQPSLASSAGEELFQVGDLSDRPVLYVADV